MGAAKPRGMAVIEQTSKPGLTAAEKGVLYAVLAHLTWGAMAVYFGYLRHVSPLEIAVHRGLWSIPCAAVIIWWLGQYKEVLQAAASRRNLAILTLTSAIIVFNWGFYVWSIEVGRTLESSLGYYINPLMNVVMGYLFLGERFNRLQMVALVLAVIAVLIQTFAAGVFPWLGLMLASTFCLYGFLRKTIAVGPTQGFFIEVCIIAIPLLLMQFWLVNRGEAHFGGTATDTLLLMGCGLMTTLALVFFALSLKLLRYSTAGLLQYISPTLVFLTAVFIFGEPMDKWKLLSFVILWIGLAIYSYSALRDEKNRRREAEALA
ncbi:MAG TPA: EamA family transporter RarD [Aestuariivirga sp.]|nr:EamA family transporter RarD [Aestuariivirga sp.]